MRSFDRAVVLGGSMAGVLAARVLADHARHVTIVDRDHVPTAGVHRRGVPQDRHIHALQTLGARVIEQLFPGATAELVAHGAIVGDWGRDTTMSIGSLRLPRFDAGLRMLTCSRPLLEGHLRQRLVQLDGVELRDGHDVTGLVLDAAGEAVVGVRLLARTDGAAEEILRADLVVDATGRGSRMPAWLEAHGFPAPEAEETGVGIAYTSCRFSRRPDDDRLGMIVASGPGGRRGGGALVVEGDSWLVTLGGMLGEHAPTDLDGYRAYAASLDHPDLHELVHDREPLGAPVLMRQPTSRRRFYERLPRFPDGIVVVGDAVCSFNPVYGQGMSVAAAEARALDRCLRAGRQDLARRVLHEAAPVLDAAWELAFDGDRSLLPGTMDDQSLPQRMVARYRTRLLEVATRDHLVARAFREVMAMVSPPSSLVRPRIAVRVLAPRRRPSTGRGTTVTERTGVPVS